MTCTTRPAPGQDTGTGPIDFARSTQLSPRGSAVHLEHPRSRWACPARNLAQCQGGQPYTPGMDVPASSVVDFYNRHPISEGQVVDALRRLGKDLERLEPEDLYDLDQDHYGGLEAVEALARRARIDATRRVLDVCAGLGGPARVSARRWRAWGRGVRRHPGRGSLAGMVRHSQAASRNVSRDARGHRGAARAVPLRRVRPALRLLRGTRGSGQAGGSALQRNSRSRNFLTAAGSLT